MEAQQNKPTYIEFLEKVLYEETRARDYNGYLQRLRAAKLPQQYNLDEYDFHFAAGISQQQLKELRELLWMEQAYNIILMGPSGTGKTFIAPDWFMMLSRPDIKPIFLPWKKLLPA